MATTNSSLISKQTTTTKANAVSKAQNLNFSHYLKSDAVQKTLASTLGDSIKAKTFTTSLITAVNTNRELATCEPNSLISSALLGETLKLSPSPQLGHYYMVPFKDNKTGTTKATFQLGWKGYYQLALRSGQYRALNAIAIKQGELEEYNPLTGEIKVNLLSDLVARDKAPTIGYYAYFELINGFKQAIYMTREQMVAHAEKYSAGYRAHKGYTFWEKDFDAMALKTMYRQLIGKYGIMSIEMQQAFNNDMTVQNMPNDNETSEPVYFDNPVYDAETGEVIENG